MEGALERGEHEARSSAATGRVPRADGRDAVGAYFDRRSEYWDDVYGSGSCDGTIYRDRLLLALRWAEQLDLAPDARVLDAGCGAGLAATGLARRGLRVAALDVSPAMVARTERNAAAAGVAARVSAGLGDVHHLPHPSGTFALAVALGVLPWVDDPAAAVRELARVLDEGGYLLVSADHRLALPRVVDPGRYWPLALSGRAVRRLAGLVRGAGSPAAAAPAPTPPAARHSMAEVDGWLAEAGLVKVRGATVGFGPFTFFDRKLLGDQESAALHRALQRLAERRVAGLHLLGWHYVVLAQKAASEKRPLVNARERNGG